MRQESRLPRSLLSSIEHAFKKRDIQKPMHTPQNISPEVVPIKANIKEKAIRKPLIQKTKT